MKKTRRFVFYEGYTVWSFQTLRKQGLCLQKWPLVLSYLLTAVLSFCPSLSLIHLPWTPSALSSLTAWHLCPSQRRRHKRWWQHCLLSHSAFLTASFSKVTCQSDVMGAMKTFCYSEDKSSTQNKRFPTALLIYCLTMSEQRQYFCTDEMFRKIQKFHSLGLIKQTSHVTCQCSQQVVNYQIKF